MEFQPRYPQPFTFQKALQLDTPIIIAEIMRLQQSLERLADTQQQLLENLSTPDPTLSQAYEENKAVISSQEERILMLRFALETKGLIKHDNPHYNLPLQVHQSNNREQRQQTDEPDDGGVFL